MALTAPRVPPFPDGTIDAHVHAGLAKYRPIEAYVATMDRLGLREAVLVGYQWNADNTYLSSCLSRYPGRFAVVGIVDAGSADAPDSLRTWARDFGVSGVRVRPTDTEAIWDVADELSLVISVTGPFDDVAAPAFARLVRRHPRTIVRIEHLGGLRHAEVGPTDPRLRSFLALADLPSVTTMLSGFWLNAGAPYPYVTARPIARAALAAFGADRVCWSGDWNRDGMDDETYRREADVVDASFGIEDPVVRRAILGGTAASLFDFNRQPRPAPPPFEAPR